MYICIADLDVCDAPNIQADWLLCVRYGHHRPLNHPHGNIILNNTFKSKYSTFYKLYIISYSYMINLGPGGIPWLTEFCVINLEIFNDRKTSEEQLRLMALCLLILLSGMWHHCYLRGCDSSSSARLSRGTRQ